MVNAARHRAVPDTSRAEHPDNTKRAEQTTSRRRTLRLIRQDVAPEKKLIGAGVVALLCEVCFRVLEPWPLKIVVDALSVSLGAKVDELSATPALLLTCGVALLAIVGARALSNYLATVAFRWWVRVPRRRYAAGYLATCSAFPSSSTPATAVPTRCSVWSVTWPGCRKWR